MRLWDIVMAAATQGGGAAAFSPIDLSPTAWYDPSNLGTLWQDVAGTTPVTADGQSVARIDDLSGNGHHLTQSTAGSRPLYKTSGGLHWLEFDGTDDEMSPASFSMTLPFTNVLALSTDVAVLRYAMNGVWGAVGLTDTGVFWMYNGGADVRTGGPAHATGTPGIVNGGFNGASSTIRVDGASYSLSGDPGSDNMTTLVIGARAGVSYFDGKLYGCILKDALLTSDENTAVEGWLAQKAGITL
jgi:hypothetical protein